MTYYIAGSRAMDPKKFPNNSRYHRVEIAKFEIPESGRIKGKSAESRIILYLKRRFVSPTQEFHVIQEHTVTKGDRLDNIAAKYLGDPEQFWRICDANNAMQPNELTEKAGRKINITLPEGIPSPTPR